MTTEETYYDHQSSPDHVVRVQNAQRAYNSASADLRLSIHQQRTINTRVDALRRHKRLLFEKLVAEVNSPG